MSSDCVFVYGTLRLHPPHPGADLLRTGSTFLGFASVQGLLYDLGSFPGAVPVGNRGGFIHGEVHRLTDPDQAFAMLDEYEGCGPDDPPPHLFRRDSVTARLRSGSEVKCAIYWFAGSTAGSRRISSGDYAMDRLSGSFHE